jgi:3-deoxy-7-phosphoheptulonate synthase
MLIILKKTATPGEIDGLKQRLAGIGCSVRDIAVDSRLTLSVLGDTGRIDPELFRTMPGVEDVIPIVKPFRLAGREFHASDTIVRVGSETIGGKDLAIIAGPCSVEGWEQLLATAEAVKAAGAAFLRGGAYKPRTSPYAFQGLKERGLSLLRDARSATGLKIVTEVKDVRTLPAVADVADVIQIGARNMSNFSLLEAAGDLDKPVLLKRGISATIEELLMSAEYILARGNQHVILCERGIRTFEPYTRNTLDLNAIPVIKKLSHLPVLVDPSHGIGMWEGVTAMALAGIAAGADGLLIEVHHDPANALSDGQQSLKPGRFIDLMGKVRQIAPIVGRSVRETRDGPGADSSRSSTDITVSSTMA